MSRFQQGSLFKLERKSCPDAWVFRWYENVSGKRTYRKQIIGSVAELRNRREAEKAVIPLRSSINAEVGTPKSVCDLAAHYRLHELTRERKAFSTIENHRLLFKRYIEPRWGNRRLGAVRTMEVEEWLHSLPLAPSSKAKLKCVLSTLYHHAIRYEWLTFNPISRIRTSQRRLRERDVLTPEEFQKLAQQLSVRDRAMVLLIGSTGLRRSEMIALTWSDLNTRTMEVNVLRSCVRNRIGKTKTESSRCPVPLHPLVLSALLEWRAQSSYATDLDFLFPSVRFKGNKPLTPDSILEKSIRPALSRIGVVGKHIGWHSFRHSLATNLRSLGVDIKVAQELMRHSSCRTTLDVYTRVVDQQKREASLKVVGLMLPVDLQKIQHPSAPSDTETTNRRCRQVLAKKGLIGGPDRDRTDDLFHAILSPCQHVNPREPTYRKAYRVWVRSSFRISIFDGIRRNTRRDDLVADLISVPADYPALLEELKKRIRTAQVRAALAVSRELVLLYWSIGRDLSGRFEREGWGSKIIDRLARDLQAEFPGVEGFSPRNLRYMRALAEAWPEPEILQQLIAKLPWGHNLRVLDRIKDRSTREWYLRAALEYGWSQDILVLQIKSRLHEREGADQFPAFLAAPDSDLAEQILKDPYNFDFLAVTSAAKEREIERGLLTHLRDLLLELGRGCRHGARGTLLPYGSKSDLAWTRKTVQLPA